ncbi:Hypothetical predicted protein [Mytilus galloprovincialis]|uniref:B box-type domain-containing protein n=1 Tax=Mytilus galloprovincialis TaxID=29158 RepID=A0A8B6BW08_MYTGA|nr:Hypothetical predicted protein [Mytilus galloprovincialis]
MASSPSGAQTVLVCEFCESETKIIGKCIDCCLLLCSKCSQKLHTKLKQALDHRIVELKDLKEQDKQEVPKSKLRATKCQIHKSQVYCLYCKTCEVFACPVCTASSHQNHNLAEIESTVKEKLNENEIIKKELEMSLSQKIEKIKEARSTKGFNLKEVKDEMTKEQDRLIFHIKNKTSSEVKALEKKWMVDDKALLEEETSLNVKLAELLENSKSIESEIEKGDIVHAVSLINITKTIQKTLRSNDCLDSDILLFDFIQGNVDLAKTHRLLGSLISFRKKKSFQSLSNPYCMALTNNGHIWISDGVQIIEYNSCDPIGIVGSIDYDCEEIRCSMSNEVFVLTEHEVMKIQASGKLKRIYDFSPCKSTTFHISKRNELTVNLESNKKYPSRIVVLTVDGKMKQEYNFSEPVILDCNSIVKTSDGLFCLISKETNDSEFRKVKMINTSREIIWEYPLNSSNMLSVDNFMPGEITESREGNLIMTEQTSSDLHILDKAGHVLKIVSTLQFGIINPSLIASDCNGNLWIMGKCYERGNNILFNLEITGF